MPEFAPLAAVAKRDDAIKLKNPKGEISAKQQSTVDDIKSLTAAATLSDIEKNLSSNTADWFTTGFNRHNELPYGLFLYALEQVHNYKIEKKVMVSEEPEKLEHIMKLLAQLYSTPTEDAQRRTDELLTELNAWMDIAPKSENDLKLCKTFLIFSKTFTFRLETLGLIEKPFVGKLLDLPAAINGLKAFSEKAKNKIIEIAPKEAAKSIEEHLSNKLPENPACLKDKDERDKKFNIINQKLEARKNELEQLCVLRSMQTLFQENGNKIGERDYFVELIGLRGSKEITEEMKLRRKEQFDVIINACDEDTQKKWNDRLEAIKNPTKLDQLATTALSVGSKTTAYLICLCRALANTELGQAVVKSEIGAAVINKAAEVTATHDSEDKKNFTDLLETRIDAIAKQIAGENPDLEALLKKEPVEKLKELSKKTECIQRLYEQDKVLADFLHQNNTRSVKLLNYLSKLTGLNLNTPMGTRVSCALHYRASLDSLGTEVQKGDNTSERIIAIETNIKQISIDINCLTKPSDTLKQSKIYNAIVNPFQSQTKTPQQEDPSPSVTPTHS